MLFWNLEVLGHPHRVGWVRAPPNSYIFTNLDVERLELADYKFDNFNITGFRIVNSANPDVGDYVKSWTQNYGHGRGKNHPLYVSYFTFHDNFQT